MQGPYNPFYNAALFGHSPAVNTHMHRRFTSFWTLCSWTCAALQSGFTVLKWTNGCTCFRHRSISRQPSKTSLDAETGGFPQTIADSSLMSLPFHFKRFLFLSQFKYSCYIRSFNINAAEISLLGFDQLCVPRGTRQI